MADYNEVRQSRLDQDERLKDFYQNGQPVDSSTSEVTNQDLISNLLDHANTEEKIAKLNEKVGKLTPNENSPVNSLDDLLKRYRSFNKTDSELSSEEPIMMQPISPEIKKFDVQNYLNTSMDNALSGTPDNFSMIPKEYQNNVVKQSVTPTQPLQTKQQENIETPTKVSTEKKVSESTKIKGSGIAPKASQELDPLAQFQNLLKLQDERNAADKAALAEANRQRNIDAALGMITSGVSKAAAGYGGGSVTQLKGDTTTEEMLNKTADQKIADIKEKMKNASDTEKDVLQKQLTLAQMQKMRDDKANDAEKLAIERAKLGIENRKLDIEKDKIGKEVPKISQDEIKMRAENRKTLKELDKDEQKTASLLKQIDDAQKTFENYSKNSIGGTGILSTVGGLTPLVSQKAGNLESKFNTLALKNLVSAFSGMSKAVDTDAERAIFQSTQPSLRNDDETNRENLRAMREAAQSMLDKIRAHKSLYNREGTFAQPSDEAQKLSDRSSGLAGKDKEAYNWASQNPNDPRAKQILQKLGM
ncbi:MAG: hypothetical protein ACKOWO_05220 [Sediminibacterium sp.]